MGSCLHTPNGEHQAHYALWPALAYRSQRGVQLHTRVGDYAGIPGTAHARQGWSCSHGATKLHRPRFVATVWRRGRLVLVGARWWCGAMSCMAVLEGQPPADFTPCYSCAAIDPTTTPAELAAASAVHGVFVQRPTVDFDFCGAAQ